MMQPIVQETATIAMVGSFNPSIFQPHWLAAKGLIRTQEAEAATIAIIQEQVADFKTDWFRLQVLQNRFLIHTLDATHHGPIRDLVAGIFSLLLHTPVNSVTIARSFHFKMESTEDWHAVGNTLAPKEFWNPLIDRAGLRSMTMQGRRKGTDDGQLLVKTEPSIPVSDGVFIEVTEEHKLKEGDEVNAEWVPVRLNKHWDAMMEYAEGVARGLLQEVGNRARPDGK
jgi:hypothetical protein